MSIINDMSEFQRTPSKVWFCNEQSPHRLSQWQPPAELTEHPEEHEAITHFNERSIPELTRTSSGSPNSHKSQDSGFSDSEHPDSFSKNLNSNYSEKYSPPKKWIFDRQCSSESKVTNRNRSETKTRSKSVNRCLFQQPLSRSEPINRSFREPLRLNVTAPAGNELEYDSNQISFEESTSLLCCSTDVFQTPQYHSTPKRIPPKQNDPPNPPVAKWLEELSKLYEAECMITLQSKSLAAELSRQVAESATKATVTIKSLFSHSKIIYSDFYTIQRQLSCDKVEHLGPLIQSLNGNITEFILTNIINSQASALTKTEQCGRKVSEILQYCDLLRSAMETDCSINELISNVESLKRLFREVERDILAIQIQLLVRLIEEPSTELALRGAVQGVTWVSTQQSVVASTFLVRYGAPRALLQVCLDSKASTLRAAALRALATVCCTHDAVRQIEQAGGVEIIAEILSEDSRPEPELSEAVAVIAQITAPWIEDNHTMLGLRENTKSLVTSLTRFLSNSKCCQNLLLCAAALSNISCMEPTSVWPLLQCRTAEKLLIAVQKRGPNISVFLKEQVATLLANMSAACESRLQLGEAKAVVALLCFLQVAPSILDESARSAEQSANLRLQQKAAVALSRLCNERSISQQVVELGGVHQLIRLCKEKRERSHSDAVLVACLAALRKISSNCGPGVMEEQDAMELVEPRLLDSFLTYASQNESYV